MLKSVCRSVFTVVVESISESMVSQMQWRKLHFFILRLTEFKCFAGEKVIKAEADFSSAFNGMTKILRKQTNKAAEQA